MPHAVGLVVLRGGRVRAGAERGGERGGDTSLERVAGELLQLHLDLLERLPLALANLDEEDLQQVAVVVRGRRAGAVRAVEEAAGHVEADGARTRLGARGGVRGAH